ncbi:MAG: formate/nitrite transporter family protein, partial [Saezia sp.]
MDQERSYVDALNPSRLASKAESSMQEKALKDPKKVLLLAIMAGLFIGLGFVYCVIANVTGAGKIVGGLVFSLGLLLVIVFGGDLFTSSSMTLIAKASKKITWGQM